MKDGCLWHKTKRRIGFPTYHPHLITCALAATWQKNWPKMKIPNLGFSVFLRGSVSRVYQLQVRSSSRMRYLHYSTLEYTRSFIKRIAKRKRKKIFLIPPPFTTAEIRPSRNLAGKNDKKWKFQILVSTCSWAAAQAGSTNCKFAVRVECDTFTILPSRILVVSLKELPNEKKKISLIPPPATAAEISPSRNLAEKTDKKWNSKFWSQRVPERQHRQGLPTARS